jgi:YegS/Rv2252/BmrU family lipid kinase
MKRAAFLINPVSGVGSKSSLERCIKRFFHPQNGWQTEFYRTTGPNDAYDAALRYKEESFDLVVAVGGDGTVNQVARALMDSAVSMGIIPTGSGNGLARHLNIPLSVSKAVALLLKAPMVSIDSGSINGHSFFCTAGTGFEAHLASRFNTSRIRGFFSYLALSATTYFHYRPQKYCIYVRDQMLEREAFSITFANCGQWGNNICIAPDANASDGLLELVIWKKRPKVAILFMAMRLLTKTINRSRHIETICGASFRVERMQEDWVQFDGEHLRMGKEIKVEVHPASLHVIAP